MLISTSGRFDNAGADSAAKNLADQTAI
jgi:hypothetical protein